MPLILKTIVILIISILLLNIQLRIVHKIFPQKEEKKKILTYTLLMGAIVASTLLVFTYYIQPYIHTLSYNNNIIYSAYIGLIGWVIALLFAVQKQRRRTFIISTLTVLAIITWVSELLFAWAWIWLIIIKASGEEILKTASAQSLSSHSTKYTSDIIIYSILAWLGFALFENIIYFISIWEVGQFLARSLTTSILHGIFTWCIWYIIRKYSKTSFLWYIIAYIWWILLHSLYNISLTYSPIAGWVLFTVGWYFLLSYLLYKSDRLYNNS